ncbi:LEA type 2 family protein [Marinomonas sp. 5E14-1]|uniref:LEA type 2 family protein n=1 Tax=Marinomonas sp. 5E14-1 TaxID=3153922 RepID=UPI003263B9C0
MFFQKGFGVSRLIFIALVVFLSGCSALQKTLDVKKPEASVTGVSIKDLSTDAVTLLVDVNVVNPNAFKLNTAGFDLDLMINKSKIATIAQPDASLSLPAKGSNNMTLPVTLTFDQVLASISGLGDKAEVDYGIEGKVAINLPVLGDIDIPVDYAGVLPVPKQPEVEVKNFNLDSIGLSGAQVSVDLEVTNPNVFDLNLNNLNYALAIEGKPIGQGNIKAIDLPQGEKRGITIPLSIGMSDMGMSLYRLMTSSDPINVDVSIGADVDTSVDGWKSTPLQYQTQQTLNR